MGIDSTDGIPPGQYGGFVDPALQIDEQLQEDLAFCIENIPRFAPVATFGYLDAAWTCLGFLEDANNELDKRAGRDTKPAECVHRGLKHLTDKEFNSEVDAIVKRLESQDTRRQAIADLKRYLDEDERRIGRKSACHLGWYITPDRRDEFDHEDMAIGCAHGDGDVEKALDAAVRAHLIGGGREQHSYEGRHWTGHFEIADKFLETKRKALQDYPISSAENPFIGNPKFHEVMREAFAERDRAVAEADAKAEFARELEGDSK